ncbi:lipoprotein-anchoring transpeptidase ErfK/SrfK [Bradyrhizobium yuanmingense]
MSMRIAVALAATIAAGALTPTAAQARPEMVGAHLADYSPGTIVVKTSERRLYLILGNGQAVRYPVGVGKAGKQWAGTTKIDGKYLNPAWAPPAEVKRDKPGIPDVIPARLAAQPDGRCGDDARRRRICDPRHQRAGLDRRLRLLWLHPHAQRRHHRSLRPRLRRHDGGRDALIA